MLSTSLLSSTWAEMATGSRVDAFSLPPPPLPHRQKTVAEEGLEKAQLACLARALPLKHVACVPPLKLSFLPPFSPTPAVRGVRTQWPLLGRS